MFIVGYAGLSYCLGFDKSLMSCEDFSNINFMLRFKMSSLIGLSIPNNRIFLNLTK